MKEKSFQFFFLNLKKLVIERKKILNFFLYSCTFLGTKQITQEATQ